MCSLKRLVQAVHESQDPTGLSRELSSKSQVICEFGLNRFWGAFCANKWYFLIIRYLLWIEAFSFGFKTLILSEMMKYYYYIIMISNGLGLIIFNFRFWVDLGRRGEITN